MKSLFATLTTLCALLCCGGENLLSTPLADWQRDFRPAESKQIYDLKILKDRTRIRRFANSTFGRIYHDLKLEPGATYRLTYDQTTPHGALVKMLVIFRGEDGKWREKTRLSNYEPLVNGEWSTGTMVFRMPDDAREARIDFRIDSFGTVDLRNVSLVKLPESEAAAYWKKAEIPPFTPGNGSDHALEPDRYYRITFDAVNPEKTPEKLKMVFHAAGGEFISPGEISFFVPAGEKKSFREVIVTAENIDGIRVDPGALEIRNLKFTPVEIR